MARAATTTDAFNAVAEPRRRELLDLLLDGERQVGELVELTGQTQPQVSKHLRVLRDVGLVTAREDGRSRRYRLNGRPLRDIHRWVTRYQELWDERFDAMDQVIRQIADDNPTEVGPERTDHDRDHAQG